MISPSELLLQRVNLLEKTYVGGLTEKRTPGAHTGGAIIERVVALSTKLDSFGHEVPALKTLYEQSLKLQPLIQQKKSSAVIISQRVDHLLTQRESLERNFKQLTQINENSKYISSENFKSKYYVLYLNCCIRLCFLKLEWYSQLRRNWARDLKT